MNRQDIGRARRLLWLAMLTTAMLFAVALTFTGGIERLMVAATLALLAHAAWQFVRLWRALERRLREAEAARASLEQARARAERISAERGRLLATASHELRTPLNGVLGMAALLAKTELTPEQANYVKAIDSSGRLLLSTVNELLEQARAEALEAGAGDQPVKEAFDPAQVAEEICELLSTRAHQKGLDMAVFVHPDISGTWLGDPVRLRQALLNLLGNAVKFTASGSVLLDVRPRRGGVRFCVVDSGPGISARERERIFEPFRQGSAHAREASSGLGLAITRRLIDIMGGRLALRSAPGRGSAFFFTLPLRRDPDQRAARWPRLNGMPVLLAIPAGASRRALACYVKAFGGKVRLVSDTQQLHALLAKGAAAGDIICDSAHGDLLRAALRDPAAAVALTRTWLLLPPEERIEARELLEGGKLAGFLLRPLRRSTFARQFIEHGGQEQVARAVRQLRKAVGHEARAREDAPRQRAAAEPVLLAEDDPVSAQVARLLLQRAGHEVVHVTDGQAAVEEMRRRLSDGALPAPCCILMDMHMPRMDGLDATQRIRRLEVATGAARTPIVALTASESAAEEARCLAAGMDGFLAKPFDEEELVGLLERLRAGERMAHEESPSRFKALPTGE